MSMCMYMYVCVCLPLSLTFSLSLILLLAQFSLRHSRAQSRSSFRVLSLSLKCIVIWRHSMLEQHKRFQDRVFSFHKKRAEGIISHTYSVSTVEHMNELRHTCACVMSHI